jgi:hypothetical protein
MSLRFEKIIQGGKSSIEFLQYKGASQPEQNQGTKACTKHLIF